MGVKTGYRPPIYLKPDYPQELLQRRYAVTRDEMLWRQYDTSKTLSDPNALRYALNILRVIREAPD
jgi:hypothetical protein